MTNETNTRLDQIERRLDQLESILLGRSQAVPKPAPPAPAPVTPPPAPVVSPKAVAPEVPIVPAPPPRPEMADSGSGTSQLLGLVGVICFILAATFLVKLAIDSGWLTPARQVGMALLFGMSLVVGGLVGYHRAKDYLGLLPAGGLIILYLASAGGQTVHHLYSPQTGVIMTSVISVMAIYIFTVVRNEFYLILAVLGSYGSSFLLGRPEDFPVVTTYFLLWDLTFGFLSVVMRSRVILLLAAYCAIGGYHYLIWLDIFYQPSNIQGFVLVQAAQFFVFVSTLVVYSLRNKQPMKAAEAWAYFPLLLFFYGIEYFLLTKWVPASAPYIALAFSVGILVLYFLARQLLGEGKLKSEKMVWTFFTITIFHSVYLEILTAQQQVWLGLLLLPLGLLPLKADRPAKRPIQIFGGIIMGIAYLRALFGSESWMTDQQVLILTFGFSLFYFLYYVKFKNTKSDTVEMGPMTVFYLLLSELAYLVATYRLVLLGLHNEIFTTEVSPFILSALWGLCGLASLFLSKLWKDKRLAQGAILILAITTAKVFLYDVSAQSEVIRILCFMMMGTVLFLGGFMLRKINQWGLK